MPSTRSSDSNPPPLTDLPQIGDRIGKFEIIRELGEGGMGVVYLARDIRLARLVALKFLLATRTENQTRRFKSEAQITARCNHENIVTLHDVGQYQGHLYMALEYVRGQSLRQWLRTHVPIVDAPSEQQDTMHAPLPVPQVLDIMVPVVRALVYAHDMGLVHLDIKPENIMITASNAVKVLDFGIARPTFDLDSDRDLETGETILPDSFQPPTHGPSGTPPYMAPEQLRGQKIDDQSDVWAVGIVLAELATGQHPMQQSLLKHASMNAPLPKVTETHPNLDLDALAGIIDRCLIKDKAHRTASAKVLLDELEGLMAPHTQPAIVRDEGPFAGLSAFQESDADRFFGRARDVQRLVAQLRAQPWLVLVGPSGCGKSSLIRAGIVPALKRSGEGWDVIIVRPGRMPLLSLAEGLAHLSMSLGPSKDERPQDLAARLFEAPGNFGVQLRQHCRTTGRRLLVFVDQFEELYTLSASPEDQAAFRACLEGAADDATSPVRVIVTLRSDFSHRAIEDSGFVATFVRSLVPVTPMKNEDLHASLTQPLKAYGYRFESSGLLETMLEDLTLVSGVLPLLQFTASRLWACRDESRRILTEQSYHDLGGVLGALAAHADTIVEVMPSAHRKLARALCLQLVTPERTRALVSMDELPQGAEAKSMLNRLIEARLLSVTQGPEDAGMVELAHESLIERWPRLAAWLEEDHEENLFCARLRTAAKTWDERDRLDALLWQGPLADEAQRWQAQWQQRGSSREDLSHRDVDFVDAVLARTSRARRQRGYVYGGAFVFVCLVAAGVSFLAMSESRAKALAQKSEALAQASAASARKSEAKAVEEATRSRNATRMAVARENQEDPTLALALIREMDPTHPPPRWRDLARWARQEGVAQGVIEHPDGVYSAAFSPNGKKIVTASRDKTARIWSSDGTGPLIILKGHLDRVLSATFSPDGTKIVTASRDKTARIWSTDGTAPPIVLKGHLDRVSSAAFSPDGTKIVTASWDKTVRVWSADETSSPIILKGHLDRVISAAFSPDGTKVVTTSDDKKAYIWSADGTGSPIVFEGHLDRVISASFSPDGTKIVTASGDKTARIWSADGTGSPIVFKGHLDRILSAAFSPDGKKIVTASGDKTARIWSTVKTGPPIILKGHRNNVYTAAFSPDGKKIVTASFDRTARIWSTDRAGSPLVLTGHLNSVLSAAFSPDGKKIVTASWDKTARIWNADGSGSPIVLEGHLDSLFSAAFSPDGIRIVTASRDKTARIWNADGSGSPLVLNGHLDGVYSAVFSLDGKKIVTASRDKTARIWNADGSGTSFVLKGHLDRVSSAAFSPDGKKIVTASFDKTARIWNTDGSGLPLLLEGHLDSLLSASFSPDGKKIVTASFDKTARIWNAHGKGLERILRGHELETISGVWGGQGAFSPDGRRVVTCSDDKTIRLWPSDETGRPIILRASDADFSSCAFSPDGSRIVTASHTLRTPATPKSPERVEHGVKVWADIQPIRDLDDPTLWAITSWCPSVELRIELLSLSPERAEREHASCLARVAATNNRPL